MAAPVPGLAQVLVLPAVLTHAEAPATLRMLSQGIGAVPGPAAAPVVADASALGRFDSSALAVLLECRRAANGYGRPFAVRGLHARLRVLAALYGVEPLLPAG